ncbi:MAG TPA: cytochrome c oxidase assembly protein [Gemmatimonadaceae bacterium]|nr:cytochrome c oxidase assembly protein [Gemmatimonadaceae bacterium]
MSAVQWWCSAQGVPWSWSWRPYPGVWLFMLLVAAAYLAPAWRTRASGGDGATWPPVRRAAAIAGLVLLWISLDWPVGALGSGYLASVHMVQYILLSLVVPPLLVAGMPPATHAALARRRRLAAVVRALTQPLVAVALFIVTFLVTHAPPVTDALMATQLGSLVLDLAWLVTGVLFWWPLVGTPPGRRALPPPGRIACLIAGAVPHTPVAMWMILASYPLYATFELAPRVYGFDARADQQVAGGIMLVVGGLYVLGMLSAIFLRWQGTGEERQRPLHVPTV